MTSSPYFIYFIAAVVLVVMLVYTFFMRRRSHGMIDDWANQNPNAATIYTNADSKISRTLKSTIDLVDVINVAAIDGVPCHQPGPDGRVLYTAKMDGSLLAVPGDHILSLEVTKSRPGVVYKTVYTTYGPIDFPVRLEPYRSYLLFFDSKLQQFGIQEHQV